MQGITQAMDSNPYSCGYLDTKTGSLAEAPNCAVKATMAAVCKSSDCQACPMGSLPHKCIRKGTDCYLFFCNDRSWYYAQSRCRSRDATLIGPQQTDRDFLVQRKAKLCSTMVWVDLTNQEWLVKRKKSNKIGEAAGQDEAAVFWDDNEPHPQGDCAIIASSTVNGESAAVWRTAECYEQHHVVCQAAVAMVMENNNQRSGMKSKVKFGANQPKRETAKGKNKKVSSYQQGAEN